MNSKQVTALSLALALVTQTTMAQAVFLGQEPPKQQANRTSDGQPVGSSQISGGLLSEQGVQQRATALKDMSAGEVIDSAYRFETDLDKLKATAYKWQVDEAKMTAQQYYASLERAHEELSDILNQIETSKWTQRSEVLLVLSLGGYFALSQVGRVQFWLAEKSFAMAQSITPDGTGTSTAVAVQKKWWLPASAAEKFNLFANKTREVFASSLTVANKGLGSAAEVARKANVVVSRSALGLGALGGAGTLIVFALQEVQIRQMVPSLRLKIAQLEQQMAEVGYAMGKK